jgi:hypothetical protein
MSALTRVATIAWTGVLTCLLASAAAHGAVASAEDFEQPRTTEMTLAQAAPAGEAALTPAADSAAPAPSPAAVAASRIAEGPAYPPSPMQTAGAIGGALLAFVLAIIGVTVTFRMMREEMRRGRFRSRRSATIASQG